MKRIISVICAFVMILCLASCAAQTDAEVIDLTNYDEKLTYIEVEKIVKDPERFVGRTIKYNGTYMYEKNNITGENMHLCVVTDETACCTTYIEFQLPEGAEYPKANTKITLSGNIQTVKRVTTTYAVILNATVS